MMLGTLGEQVENVAAVLDDPVNGSGVVHESQNLYLLPRAVGIGPFHDAPDCLGLAFGNSYGGYFDGIDT
jgi:hypothetical protein